MSEPVVYRCWCGRRIKKAIVDRAIASGKVPKYCSPPHRAVMKMRNLRKRKKEAGL